MKIGRFGDANGADPYWGVIDVEGGTVRRLVGGIAEWGPLATADPDLIADRIAVNAVPLEAVTMLAPIEPTAKVVAAGATYARHIEGLGLQMSDRPAVFLKTAESIVGPGDEIAYPAVTRQLDYEGELVVIIGRHVAGGGADAAGAILGYAVGNDVSARDLQFSGGATGMDMFSAKALDGTSPLGPWIVTRDECGEGTPDLELTVTVDGEVRQQDRTSSLAFGVGDMVSYVSERSALRAGDVLFTGTPAGVGHEDGRHLESGQEVVVTIERIGTLRNRVGPRASSAVPSLDQLQA